ncbi:MAG: hypothetical protein AABY22_12810 [Nanoarchaeota archaeon]
MRSKIEISEEIKSLLELKPIGKFKTKIKTKNLINFAVEELKFGFDQTAEEWEEYTDSEQDIVVQTNLWKNGDIDEKPSESFENLVK